ncbi:hypothetical protein B9Q12_01050 [Candidatus Marsarchaeota G2 archaeon ECH_B_SAG-G06]|uniref:Uncharacterized protein n=1 Tax=Candidatus Marsarchaeota G2 archaeon ECH_B_SAG-G06 TaxID=1978166 RepID=A0A2R6C2L0_9ARCH|nr:MAG: hypothetical protein B9Q12_01050 [Candidatus Marsarchaeota G2 archaeon ECH_B_SAG-G06]
MKALRPCVHKHPPCARKYVDTPVGGELDRRSAKPFKAWWLTKSILLYSIQEALSATKIHVCFRYCVLKKD